MVSPEGSGFEVESESGVVVAQAQQTKPVRCNSDNDERRANARLIAAAPLMYEALEEIMHAIDKEYGPRAANFPKARAALQAAKGGGDNGEG